MEGSISERASRNARRGREEEKREVAYYVRAKTGPGQRDWATIGVALERKHGQPGFSIKLNTLPIDRNWNGGMVLVPPQEEQAPAEEE